MKKYLVNYRVLSIRSTTPIPYLEYTAIYETEGVMTQEDVEEEISLIRSEFGRGHLTKEEFEKKVANEKNTLGLRLIPLYLYPSLPIGITLTSIDGEEIVFDGSNIDTDIRFGCLAWGIKPKKKIN